MDHATGAMGSLLLKLGDLIVKEYKLQTGVKEDVEYMKRELTSMYIALRKVGDIPKDQLDLQVKSWADEVKDLSYMMEDIIDKFLVSVKGAEPTVKPRKLKRLMKKMGDLFTKSKTSHEISDEIKGIKVRVQEAADRRERYKLSDVVANPSAAIIADPHLLSLYKDKKDLVRIDGPLSELTNMLCDGHGDMDKQLKIVSIFGFGGLGKTTLAKALFDKLQSPFDCSAFVPVGRNPIMKEVLNNVLFEIDKTKQPELNEKQLIDKLRGLLESKRYFIVIDDIWDTEAWEIFKCALVNNCCGSRIITTTRILDVAEKTGKVYRIKSLSNDLSKELFHRRLSGGNRKNPSDLPAKVYDKILQKCGDVPLAIITIASLLDNKPVEFWSKMYNSIGFGHENNHDVDNTRKILLFSYYDLPCHLRTCLLHLSIYPEDRLIEKDDLIWLWVGEGFIMEEPGVGLFEIGEKYFNELLNKSMLLPVENPDDGFVSGCRLHDIVLDMICQLAKEENFVTILDSNDACASAPTNARRLSIGNKEVPLDSTIMLQVRSFNAIDYVDKLPSLSCFNVLRVLNIEHFNSTPHLEHLGKLVHLRYLGIGSMNIRVPEETGYLKFLQVLKLDSSNIKELPKNIGLLNQLKCLKAKGACITVDQDWIGKLTCLEELWVCNVDSSLNFATELGKLTDLRRLQIQYLDFGSVSLVKAWTGSLVKLQKIKVIHVQCIRSRYTSDVTLEGYVPPQKLGFNLWHYETALYESIKASWLPNLSHLFLHVDSPDVEIFGRFPGLVYLCLYKDRPFQGHHVMGGVGAGLFPKLRFYHTSAMPGPFLPGAMPSLEALKFWVDVWTSRNGNIEFDFGSLVNLSMLKNVTINMLSGRYITDEDRHKAEETVMHAVDSHPNHPTLLSDSLRFLLDILDDPDEYGV